MSSTDSPIRPYGITNVPPHLDGSQGSNRAPLDRLLVPLADDREAMGHFLDQYEGSAGTHRIYGRECERLALWALHVKQKPMSSLSVVDIEHYIQFLGNPQPAAQWCGPKAKRESGNWRPFVGPLEASARLTALSAINSMMGYWVQAGYLAGNPLGLFRQLKQKILSGVLDAPQDGGKKSRKVKAVVVSEDVQKVERYLDEDMWLATMQAVESMKGIESAGAQAEYERARFLMAFLYMLAPRAGELETHTMNSFRDERGRWWWQVIGKGKKQSKVPVPDDMLQALIRYRKHLGLPAVPDSRDDSPLLRSVRHPGEGITARRLNQILKQIFNQAAKFLPAHAQHKAEKLRRASAHWGRHTSITAKIDAGVSHLHTQQDARHSDFGTTQRYIHNADEARHDDAQKQRLNWKDPGRDDERPPPSIMPVSP